jgi:hypothetical protein
LTGIGASPKMSHESQRQPTANESLSATDKMSDQGS